jgi:hypothetical protein
MAAEGIIEILREIDGELLEATLTTKLAKSPNGVWVGAIIVPAADYSAFRVRVTNLGDATAALDLDRAQSTADGASQGASGDFEFEESPAIVPGNSSSTRSFAGYSRGALTVRVNPNGSTAAGSAVVRLMCRDTEDGLWVPFGNQVTIAIPAGGGFAEQRLTWSNQVTRDIYLEFVSCTISQANISTLCWRFGR